MDRGFQSEALRLAARALVSGSVASTGGSQAALIERLLEGYGRPSGLLGRWVVVDSPSPTKAQVARLALNLISGVAEHPRFAIFPAGATRTYVLCVAPLRWRRIKTGLITLYGMLLLFSLFTYESGGTLPWLLIGLGLIGTLWAHIGQQGDVRRFETVLGEGRAMVATQHQEVVQAVRETQQHHEILSLIYQAERNLRHTTTLADLFPLIARYLKVLIPDCDSLSIWRLDETGLHLEIQYAEGWSADEILQMTRVPRDTGAIGKAVASQQSYVIPDLLTDQHSGQLPGIDQRGSGLALPIYTIEGPSGVIMLTRPDPGEFAPHQVWGCELLAGVAGLRIHALLVRDREQQLMEEFTRLGQAFSPQLTALRVGDPMEQVGISVAVASQADGAIVYRLVSPGGLMLSSVHGLPMETAALLRSMDAASIPASLALSLDVLTDLSRADLVIWPEFRPFFDEVEAERCLILPIQWPDGKRMAAVVLIYRRGREGLLTPERLALCDTYARYAGATVHNLELYATVMSQSAELRTLLGRVVDAQERERSRIALDLHDWLVQGLTAPSFAIQAAQRLLERSPTMARTELRMALEQLNRASDEMRRIMKGLHPHLLDELGLTEAIKAYALEFSQAHGTGCRVISQAERGPARGSQEALVAFRIVQEALNNVAKHAGATRVAITIGSSEDSFEILVVDDGCGFDARENSGTGHLGLLGMQERASAVGGQVVVTSLPGEGTKVHIKIPLSGSLAEGVAGETPEVIV